jgi:small-conductance mechanosensitive channel
MTENPQIDFDKAILVTTKNFADSSFYWQSISVLTCLILSYLIYSAFRKYLLPTIIAISLKKNIALHRLFTRYLIPIFYPVIVLFLLAISNSIYLQFFKEDLFFTITLKLIGLFVFLRFIRISSDNKFFANSAGIILMPTMILDIFGLLDSTIFYLDQFALKIGDFRISVYLFLKGFVVILILFWLSSLISRKSKSFIENSKSIKSSTKNIISKAIDITVCCVIAIVLLKTFGVDMTTLAVLGGAIGVGIGFGLQKIASNFISGIILLLEKSVELGDWVEIDNGNIFGVVKKFGGRYTLIECFDGKEIMVPNEEFIINKVSNWTYSNNRARIEINLGVAQKSDLIKTKEIMLGCAVENPRCISYPEPECYVTSFGEYDVKFTLFFWINDIVEGRMKPKSEVMLNIWKKLKENKIEISIPQREVTTFERKKKIRKKLSEND